MGTIRAIIIDDEPKSCKLLQLLIEEIDSSVKILDSFTDPELALIKVPGLEIDLIFLDVEMPSMSGFDFVQKLGDSNILIVFVTGYDRYALQALKIAAIGYVLKPIDTHELESVLREAHNRVDQSKTFNHNKILLENLSLQNAMLKKIGIPSAKGIDFIKMNDIIYCEGSEKYTQVFIENRKPILSSYSIGEFVKIIEDAGFFHVHRSYIVNLSKIKQYQKDGTLTMDNGTSVPVARRRKDEFLKSMTTLKR